MQAGASEWDGRTDQHANTVKLHRCPFCVNQDSFNTLTTPDIKHNNETSQGYVTSLALLAVYR
jgi:hypothetical protein